jgi:hypothetical protein
MPFEQITTNIGKLVRRERMAGRDYDVAPMVMITEGVHNGSGGPLLYTAEELEKFPAAWNHKPIVVYHPQRNGTPVSACDPDVITRNGIGVVMNTHYKPGTDKTPGKLHAEAWIEVGRADVVDKRVVEAIQNNATMELSTGLYTDNESTRGEWRGESYTAIAKNYRPDHLALLPDQVGSCSRAKGAGFLRNNAAGEPPAQDQRTITNEKSFGDISNELGSLIRKAYGDNT